MGLKRRFACHCSILRRIPQLMTEPPGCLAVALNANMGDFQQQTRGKLDIPTIRVI